MCWFLTLLRMRSLGLATALVMMLISYTGCSHRWGGSVWGWRPPLTTYEAHLLRDLLEGQTWVLASSMRGVGWRHGKVLEENDDDAVSGAETGVEVLILQPEAEHPPSSQPKQSDDGSKIASSDAAPRPHPVGHPHPGWIVPAGTPVRLVSLRLAGEPPPKCFPLACASQAPGGLEAERSWLVLSVLPTQEQEKVWPKGKPAPPIPHVRILLLQLSEGLDGLPSFQEEIQQYLAKPSWAQTWLSQRRAEVLAKIWKRQVDVGMSQLEMQAALGQPYQMRAYWEPTGSVGVEKLADYGALQIGLRDDRVATVLSASEPMFSP